MCRRVAFESARAFVLTEDYVPHHDAAINVLTHLHRSAVVGCRKIAVIEFQPRTQGKHEEQFKFSAYTDKKLSERLNGLVLKVVGEAVPVSLNV